MKIYNFGQTLASHVIYYNGSNASGTDHACIINVFNKNRKSLLNMLLLYILVVVLDMGYEYFIIQRFGYEWVMYEIPGACAFLRA